MNIQNVLTVGQNIILTCEKNNNKKNKTVLKFR